MCVYVLPINRWGFNHTQQYTWFPIRYVCSARHKNIRGTSTKLQREHENKNKANKNDKNKETMTQSICQKKIEERHSIESFVCHQPRAIRYPPNRNYLAFAPKGVASATPYSQGFRLLYRRTVDAAWGVCPWVGPIHAALKNLKLATVTSGATFNLVRLFRFSLPLPVFERFFLFLRPRGLKPTAPFTYCTVLFPRSPALPI